MDEKNDWKRIGDMKRGSGCDAKESHKAGRRGYSNVAQRTCEGGLKDVREVGTQHGQLFCA